MMREIVEQALSVWGMGGAEYQLIAARENMVYRVTTSNDTVALRLHRQGYRTDKELWSELQWMAASAKGDISVPEPIPSTTHDFLHIIDGVQVDVLTWLSGAPVSSVFATLSVPERSSLFFGIGHSMAKLHDISDAWTKPEGFTRCAWNRDGLLGEAPLWNRFWDNPELSPQDRQLFSNLREVADAELARIESDLDYGLIHADMVRDNVMIDGDRMHLIDFDDGGFGFRIFDIATALLKNLGECDYPALKAAFINGYTSVRVIDLTALDLFLVLRSTTYVGWNMTRMREDRAGTRNERFISAARHLTRNYLLGEPLVS